MDSDLAASAAVICTTERSTRRFKGAKAKDVIRLLRERHVYTNRNQGLLLPRGGSHDRQPPASAEGILPVLLSCEGKGRC